MAVNCAILSYNGSVYFGFSGDMHAAPDLKRLEKLLQLSFADLRVAVDPRSPHTMVVRGRRTSKKRAVERAKASPPQSVELASILESKQEESNVKKELLDVMSEPVVA